jgi:hypothetical protein
MKLGWKLQNYGEIALQKAFLLGNKIKTGKARPPCPSYVIGGICALESTISSWHPLNENCG